MNSKVDVGQTLRSVFGEYGRQAGVLLPAALIVYLPVAIVIGLLLATEAGVILLPLTIAVSSIAAFLYQGVVVEAVRDMRDGRRDFSIPQLFNAVVPVLPALIVAGLIAGIGIALGLVLLIVPGLFLLTIWGVLAPVVVIERRRATEALGRSRELVRGNGWQVFGVLVVMLLISVVAANVLEGLFVAISEGIVGYSIGNLVAQVLTAPLSAIAATILFFELGGGRPAEATEAEVPAPVH